MTTHDSNYNDLDYWSRCTQKAASSAATSESAPISYRERNYPWANYFQEFVNHACRPAEGVGKTEGPHVMCPSYESALLVADNLERNLKKNGILYEPTTAGNKETKHYGIYISDFGNRNGPATVTLSAVFQHHRLDETFKSRMIDFVLRDQARIQGEIDDKNRAYIAVEKNDPEPDAVFA